MGAAAEDVVFRLYREDDREQVRRLKCRNPGQKWTKEAERVIREAPDLIAKGVEGQIIVAIDQKGRVVGAVVFGPDPDVDGRPTIASLGVVRTRREEKIGTRLKQAALAELAAAGHRQDVFSQVHKYNRAMLGLNDKLGVKRERDPDRMDHFLSYIAVEAEGGAGEAQ